MIMEFFFDYTSFHNLFQTNDIKGVLLFHIRHNQLGTQNTRFKQSTTLFKLSIFKRLYQIVFGSKHSIWRFTPLIYSRLPYLCSTLILKLFLASFSHTLIFKFSGAVTHIFLSSPFCLSTQENPQPRKVGLHINIYCSFSQKKFSTLMYVIKFQTFASFFFWLIQISDPIYEPTNPTTTTRNSLRVGRSRRG